MDYEVVVVDDGSKDRTHCEVERAIIENPKIKLIRQENFGKGSALKNGVFQTSGDLIAFIDADLDLHPKQLNKFMQIMEETNADIVIGSKRHPDSRIEYPLKRRILSQMYQYMILILFHLNVRDTQVGLKLFKREPILHIMPKILVKRYAFDLEVLVNATRMGYNIKEAPIYLNFQRFENRIKIHEIKDIFKDTIAIYYRLHILKYYDK